MTEYQDYAVEFRIKLVKGKYANSGIAVIEAAKSIMNDLGIREPDGWMISRFIEKYFHCVVRQG